MEEIKKRYFDGNDILTDTVAEDMLQRPGDAKEILKHVIRYAGFLMKKEYLERKYRRKFWELYAEYDIDFNK